MWCSTCAKTVERAVGRLAGVAEVHINYASKLLFVQPSEPAASRRLESEIPRVVTDIGFAIRQQSPGWIQSFRDDMNREEERPVSALEMSLIVFLSMWCSMLAFTGYLGELTARQDYGLVLLSSAFGFPAVFLGVRPFARAGLRALVKSRTLTLDLFVAIGAVSAVIVSATQLAKGSPVSYLDSSSMVLLILLLAKLAEANLMSRVSGRILSYVEPREAEVEALHRERWTKRRVDQIRRGDRVRCQADEVIPFDGEVLGEAAMVNAHLLDGEGVDCCLRAGDQVLAGSLARSSLEVRVTAPLGLRRIDEWAESALLSRGRSHTYSERLRILEGGLVSFALMGALLLGLWRYHATLSLAQGWQGFFIGVLIFCPCLFASILPLSAHLAHLALAKIGASLQRVECLFDLTRVERFYFDKTGTLEGVDSWFECFREDVRPFTEGLLSQLCHTHSHPILRGLRGLKSGSFGEDLEVRDWPGEGVVCRSVGGAELIVGRPDFVRSRARPPQSPGARLDGHYPLVALDGRVVGRLITKASFDKAAERFLSELLDELPEDRSIAILSGDPDEKAGQRFCDLFGQRVQYRGALRPDDKPDCMGERSFFAGDGLNDTLALAKATVSCQLGTRAMALSQADICLEPQNLPVLLDVLRYSRKYVSVLKQTGLLALSYNLLAWSLAACGKFSPVGAVTAMLTSSVLLALSVLRLRKVS